MGNSRLDRKEYQDHILSYIAQTGYEKDCCNGIPVAYSTYRKYKKDHSEFAEQVEEAKKLFAGLPQNVTAKIHLVKKLYDEVEHGAKTTIEFFDENGNLSGSKTFYNPPRQWVAEKFFPKLELLEKALVLVLGAEFKFLKAQEIPEEHHQIIREFLQLFQQEGQAELIKRGIDV